MPAETAGDFDYERHGHVYASQRQADPRIAASVHRALGGALTVLNVGAGTGSYEPEDRHVVAVEPSAAMRARRPRGLAPAVDAAAERLPFDDDAFDAAMATVTVHQWADTVQGLRQMLRVSRGPVVILTFDADALDRFWIANYAPELIEAERRQYPPIAEIRGVLGGSSTVEEVPVPIDCIDGFTEAFYARPERFLDDTVRRSQSGWAFLAAGVEERAVRRLATDLGDGGWDARFGRLRSAPTFASSLRLITAHP